VNKAKATAQQSTAMSRSVPDMDYLPSELPAMHKRSASAFDVHWIPESRTVAATGPATASKLWCTRSGARRDSTPAVTADNGGDAAPPAEIGVCGSSDSGLLDVIAPVGCVALSTPSQTIDPIPVAAHRSGALAHKPPVAATAIAAIMPTATTA
jgi:hypothetical protein